MRSTVNAVEKRKTPPTKTSVSVDIDAQGYG